MLLGIRYGQVSDNVAPKATITATAPDAAYPAANVVDGDPAHPSKQTGGAGAWAFQFPAQQRVDAVALIHHNLTPGLDVRVQASNDGSAWNAFDAAITIPPYREDGFCVNPWRDLTSAPGYTPTGFAYWRVVVMGTNAAPPALGELVLLSHLRTLDRNPQWGFHDTEDHPLIEHKTDLGVVRIYEYGTLARTYGGQIIASAAGARELRTLARDARFRARPWLFIPEASANEAWWVRFTGMPQDQTHELLDANPMLWTVEELARGLPL
jgi:hypothetical protein